MPNLDSLGIELVDRDLGMLSVPRGLRSIRFKNLSFENISRAWRNFRFRQLSKLANVIEKAQNNIIGSFSPSDFNQGISNTEVGSMLRIPVRTRLEDKVNILNNPVLSKSTTNMSRAIKLKDHMNRNARLNAKSFYSDIDSQNNYFPMNASYAIDNSDKAIEPDENKNIRDEIIIVPDRDEVKRIVNDEFARQEKEVRNVSAEEVADVVESPADKVEVGGVDTDAFKKSVDEAIEKINISRNSSSAAKIEKYSEPSENKDEEVSREEVADVINNSLEEEKEREKIRQAVEEAISKRVTNDSIGGAKIEYFSEPANDMINEDGTYRLTKDQIDEEFRKTYINEPKQAVRENKDDKVEFEITNEFDNKDVKGDEHSMDGFNTEEKKLGTEEEAMRYDYDADEIHNLTSAANGDRANPRSEIEILMERVRTLKQMQQESKERADKAAEQARASEDAKDDAFSRLRAYADALEEDSGYNNRSAEENLKKAQNNEKLVEDMLNMIQPQANPDSVRTR